MKIGVVASAKSSDALLCQSLERAGNELVVIRYQMPLRSWVPWLMKRTREIGITSVPGHFGLSIFVRCERLIDRMAGKSIWKSHGLPTPSWGSVHARVHFTMNEERLLELLEGVECVLLMNQTRLTSRFYRSLKKPCAQIIWGAVPDYLGDSGIFWSYALQDWKRAGVSVVLRSGQFNRFHVVRSETIQVNDHETLRTLKVKQVKALAGILPGIVSSLVSSRETSNVREQQATYWHAPTLWQYVKFLRSRKLSMPKKGRKTFTATLSFSSP